MHPGLEVKGLICFIRRVRGLIKFEKIQKFEEKNSEVCGWGFLTFVHVSKEKSDRGGGVDVVRPNRVLLGFLDLFKLDKTPKS